MQSDHGCRSFAVGLGADDTQEIVLQQVAVEARSLPEREGFPVSSRTKLPLIDSETPRSNKSLEPK